MSENRTMSPIPASWSSRYDAATCDALNAAYARLEASLVAKGWRVRRSRRGVKARWRWLSISVRPSSSVGWRVRLRDGMPRVTVHEATGADMASTVDAVVSYALEVENFCVGAGLFSNPSKSYLGHRLWQAVRPVDPSEARA